MGLRRGHGSQTAPARHGGRHLDAPARTANPLVLLDRWASWFERRGVYTQAAERSQLSAWRDFSWWITGWLVTVGVFVLVFAVAS